MKVALDTNRYVDLCKGVAPTTDLLASAEAVFMPFVVAAELRAGFAVGRRSSDNEKVLRLFLSKDGVRVLFPDDRTIQHYAAVYRQLRRQGTPIPTHDVWIAALVLQHDLVLHSRDRHFDHLPQISRV